MPQIPENFPHSMTDTEIEESIKEYMRNIIESDSQENVVIQNYPLVSLGQYELQKRQTDRITRITIGATIFSSVVAAIALYIAITNSHFSEGWKVKQLSSLNILNTENKKQNSNLSSMINKLNGINKNIENINGCANYSKKTANKLIQRDFQKVHDFCKERKNRAPSESP